MMRTTMPPEVCPDEKRLSKVGISPWDPPATEDNAMTLAVVIYTA
jgi:hypothetical protein